MKRYTLYILVAILGMLNIQPAEAQQKQDALYVFRNDGKFNAFYYADIERIEYSKVDTLGKEQSDYVVQEIYALDSIFRIPISAIDSVLFVTPETKYKADVIRPDKTMTDYIVASDSVSWFRLSASAPSSVIPKVGDKILIENSVKQLPYGFSGIVSKVSNGSDGTTIETDAPALEDLYDRLIVKGAAGSQASANARTRGVNAIDGSLISTEPIELPTFSGSATAMNLSGDLISFTDNVKISIEGSLALSYSITPKITDFRAFFYWDVIEGVKLYEYLKLERSEKYAVSLSGTLSGNADIPFTIGSEVKNGILSADRKTVTKRIGGFDVELSYGWFINGKWTVSSEISSEKVGTSLYTMSYDMPAYHIPTAEDFFTSTAYSLSTEKSSLSGWAAGLSGSTGLYAKAGIKIACLEREIETEARLEAGARLEENLGVSTTEIGRTDFLERGSIFESITKEGSASRYFYASGAITMGLKMWLGMKWTPININPEVTLSKKALFRVVPSMNSITWEADKKAPWRGTLTVPLGGDLLFSKKVGLAAYDMTDEKNLTQVLDFWKMADYESPTLYSEIKEVIDDFEPSRTYKAWPQVNVCGYPVIANKEVEIKLGAPMMDIKPKAVEFDENPGYKDIEVITNVKNTEFTTEDAWLNETKPTWNNEEGRLTVHAPALPDGTDTRKGYVIGVGYDKDGKELLRDTVTITQLRPILQASPNPVTFEQKGGTVKVTLNTTLAQIEAQIQEGGNLDKFFTMTLNADNTITVTAPENTTGQELSGNIIVKGTSPGGQKAELNLNVIQKGDGGEQSQYWLKISPEEYSFDVNGGTARFIVTDNVPDELINDFEWIASTQFSGDKWFTTKWDGDDYLFTAEKNTTGKERTAIITFKLKSEKHNVYIEKTVTLTQSTEENTNILSKYDFTLEFTIWGHSEEQGDYSLYLPHINCEISDVTHHSDGTTTIRYEEHTPVRANEFQKIELKVKVDDDGQLVVLSGSAEALGTSFFESYADHGYDIGYYNVTFPQITSKSITSYMIGDNLTTDRDKYSVFFGDDIKLSGSSYEDYHNNATDDYFKHYRVNCSDLTGKLDIVLYRKK